MKTLANVLIGFLLLAPVKTLASDSVLDAKELYIACTTPDAEWVSFCHGYMQAVNDFAVSRGISCTPPDVTRNDMSDSYQLVAPLIFSREDFDNEATTGFAVAIGILSTQFPCN